MTNGTSPSKRQRRSGSRRSPSRRLSLAVRMRDAVRRGADRVLGADLAWGGTLAVLILLLLGTQRCGVSYERMALGDVAPRDVRAHTDLEVTDHGLTEQLRQEARERVPEVYVHDIGRAARIQREFSLMFRQGREALEAAGEDETDQIRKPLEDRVGAAALEVLIRRRFSTELENSLLSPLSRIMDRLVIGSKAILERSPSVVLVHVPGEREETLDDYGEVLDLSTARELVRREVRGALEIPSRDEQTLADLVARFVDADVTFDPGRTSARREEAAAAVSPVLKRISRGTLLVEEGQRVTTDTLARLEAARQGSPRGLGLPEVLGLVMVVVLLAFFLWRYTRYHQRHYKQVKHLHAMLALVLMLTAVLVQGLLWLTGSVVDNLSPPFNEVDVYVYLIPIGAGPILVSLLANGRIAMVYSAFSAILFGALAGWDFYAGTWALMVQWTGVYAIATYRERAALLRAGLVVGGAGAALALVFEVLAGNFDPASRSLYAAGLAFAGGAIGVGLLISFALPPFETLFNVLTDVRLLELSNLNTPLLSQFAVKAPGSYNHSLVLANLTEEAAKAIGGNSLLCRVAAFYHDIGKIKKPEYYVENMRGTNPHDRLSPSMSALIISAHVKEGIQLAREAGLPQQIIDIVPQHHGTRLMTYFYERAKKTADPSLGPVTQEDFRYPGPKPQTKEAAIFMLADGVEAAARTLEGPTPNRLREVIEKISNAVVLDGQLDECDLTFVDLTRIKNAFYRTLVSFHHQRVDYPGFEFNTPRGAGKRQSQERPARSTASAGAPAAEEAKPPKVVEPPIGRGR